METKASGSPKVSAVIPTRNRPVIVRRAIESVRAQTFQDFEIIVVVDGPDQATEEMIESIRDERIRVVSLPESVGGSEARNIGAQASRGEYVALLDDDDEWLPTKIEKQVAAAESASGPVLVVCSFFLKTKSEQAIAPTRFPHAGEPISEYLFGFPRHGFQTSGFFCSKELFNRIPWRRLKGLQDIDWFLRVVSQEGVRFEIVREPLCVYWTESENTITSKLDWKSCLDWGQNNRSLMTKKAYSSFIAKVCAQRAAKQKASLKEKAGLLRELIFKGLPTPSSIMLFAAYSFVSYERRRSFANRMSSFRPTGASVQ
jgi:glycosyltransferase involved in cell wall biosynthesis